MCEQLELSASSKPWAFLTRDRNTSTDQGRSPGRQGTVKVAGEVAGSGGQGLIQGRPGGLVTMKPTRSDRK